VEFFGCIKSSCASPDCQAAVSKLWRGRYFVSEASKKKLDCGARGIEFMLPTIAIKLELSLFPTGSKAVIYRSPRIARGDKHIARRNHA